MTHDKPGGFTPYELTKRRHLLSSDMPQFAPSRPLLRSATGRRFGGRKPAPPPFPARGDAGDPCDPLTACFSVLGEADEKSAGAADPQKFAAKSFFRRAPAWRCSTGFCAKSRLSPEPCASAWRCARLAFIQTFYGCAKTRAICATPNI